MLMASTARHRRRWTKLGRRLTKMLRSMADHATAAHLDYSTPPLDEEPTAVPPNHMAASYSILIAHAILQGLTTVLASW